MNKLHAIPDERPTTPTLPTTNRMLVFASRIERLCDLAMEKLEVGPDADAVAAALGDLVEIRALASRVAR
jgi:hypothetical protein